MLSLDSLATLRVTNLGYREGDGVDLNLMIHPRQVIHLCGDDGVGKSRLMHTLMGWRGNTRGEIFWENQKINEYATLARARLGLGLVPHENAVFDHLTVFENLSLGEWKPQRSTSYIQNFLYKFPRLWQARFTRGEKLSGGEKKTVALLRALVGRPRLLLLDEPIYGLASDTVVALRDLLLTWLNSDLSPSLLYTGPPIFEQTNAMFLTNGTLRSSIPSVFFRQLKMTKTRLFECDLQVEGDKTHQVNILNR